MKTTRRLTLPGGGSVDIQLDDVVESAPLAGGSVGASTPWLTIVAGAALGGALTWLLVRLSRPS